MLPRSLKFHQAISSLSTIRTFCAIQLSTPVSNDKQESNAILFRANWNMIEIKVWGAISGRKWRKKWIESGKGFLRSAHTRRYTTITGMTSFWAATTRFTHPTFLVRLSRLLSPSKFPGVCNYPRKNAGRIAIDKSRAMDGIPIASIPARDLRGSHSGKIGPAREHRGHGNWFSFD